MGIRITKKLLDDYRKYKREIPLLQTELGELLTTDAGIGNSVICNYQKGYPQPQSIVGFDKELYKRRYAALELKKEEVKNVEEWIKSIDDGQTRYVFKARYIDGMSWTKIAEKTGYAGKPDYVRLHIRDKYLKKCKIR